MLSGAVSRGAGNFANVGFARARRLLFRQEQRGARRCEGRRRRAHPRCFRPPEIGTPVAAEHRAAGLRPAALHR